LIEKINQNWDDSSWSWVNNSRLIYSYQSITKVEQLAEVIESYSLSNNYPNPFNPTTTIIYSIPELSFVTLKIYDGLGCEVATLVNEEKPAGNYELNWSAASAAGGLPSGVYFYQLKAGNYVETKKMILIK